MDRHSLAARLLTGFLGFTYVAAMPGFCFITGFFSTASPGQRHIANQVRFSLAWFIQHSFSVMMCVVGHYAAARNTWLAEHPDLNRTNAALRAQGKPPLESLEYVVMPFFQITGPDWYLWCVIIWRCVLPLLAMLHRPLLISFILAFVMIWTDAFSTTYGMAPFAFLPFFVAGFLFKNFVKTQPEQLQALRDSVAAKLGFAVSMLVMVGGSAWRVDVLFYPIRGISCMYGGSLAQTVEDVLKEYVLWFEVNLAEAQAVPPTLPPHSSFCQSGVGLVNTLVFYIAAFFVIMCFVSIVPGNKISVLTKAGVNSIYIYFTHIWFGLVPLLGVAMAIEVSGNSLNPWLTLTIMVLAVIGCMACLSHQWVLCFCGPCIEPDVELCCQARSK